MRSYKTLYAWQEASELCLATLEAADEGWTPRANVVFEQLRRASLSVDINIVEGYALNTVGLFRHHLRIAIGSAAETERLLEIAGIRGYLRPDVVAPLRTKADLTLGALFGLLRSPRLRSTK